MTFTGLSSLALSGNPAVTGSLPASYSALTALSMLDLSANALSGTLPGQWSTLAQLTRLNLGA